MIKPLILCYVLGPLDNNSYLLVDQESKDAAVIDPSDDPETLLVDAQQQGIQIKIILLTHAHFDHIAGVVSVANSQIPAIPVALHPDDLELYRQGGGAGMFGLPFDPVPEPEMLLTEGQVIQVGSIEIEVRHTPGHTAGHVVFICHEAEVVFCGDLIFAGSVGRTDLPGGSYAQLLESIQRHILPLPPETSLLSGHGPETTVGKEASTNPYL